MKPTLYFKENYSLYTLHKQCSNGYCLSCNKPIIRTSPYCVSCFRELLINFQEKTYVRTTDIAIRTINYQQYLNRAICNCNAPYKYRGKKEDRIIIKDKNKVCAKAAKSLNLLLKEIEYIYDKKEYSLQRKQQIHIYAYNKIKEKLPHIHNRILLNIILQYIIHFIEPNTPYKSDNHFYISMIQSIFKYIEYLYIKLYGSIYSLYNHFTYFGSHLKTQVRYKRHKYIYHLIESITAIIEPIMGVIADARFKRHS